MSTATIASITVKPRDAEIRPDRFARDPLDRAQLVAGLGIDGDRKAQAGDRQLNVMLAETVAQLRAEGFKIGPGELGEQLVIAGLSAIPVCTRLRIGDTAIIELHSLRVPCTRFSQVQGKPSKLALERIGYMATVVVGGEIAVGSEVVLVPDETKI